MPKGLDTVQQGAATSISSRAWHSPLLLLELVKIDGWECKFPLWELKLVGYSRAEICTQALDGKELERPLRSCDCTRDFTLSSRKLCWQYSAISRNREHMPNMTESGTEPTYAHAQMIMHVTGEALHAQATCSHCRSACSFVSG